MAVKFNRILKKKNLNRVFISMLIKIANLQSPQSVLLPLIYSLSCDPDIILLDEPYTYLSTQE